MLNIAGRKINNIKKIMQKDFIKRRRNELRRGARGKNGLKPFVAGAFFSLAVIGIIALSCFRIVEIYTTYEPLPPLANQITNLCDGWDLDCINQYHGQK